MFPLLSRNWVTLDREVGFRAYGRMRPAQSTYVLSYAAILAAMCLPLDAYAASQERFIPDCAGKVEIAHARVLRVEQDGALVLTDKRSLQLEGIRLPLDSSLAESRPGGKTLSDLAQSGTVSFTVTPPLRDRYSRLRVQGFGAAMAASRAVGAGTRPGGDFSRSHGMRPGLL